MSNELQHPVREPIANELIHAVVVITVVAATGKVISYTFEQDADFQKWVIAGLSVLVIGLSYVALRCYKRIWKDSREIAALQSLEKWRKLEEITGLIGFSPQLKNSIYHPKALLARDNIMNLKILGNGCSKWTTSSPTDLRNAAHQCSSGRGKMQFLLQSPTILLIRQREV